MHRIRPSRARLLLGGLLLGLAAPAYARVYPSPIDVDSEEELRTLYEDGLLTEDDYETLVGLLDNPLDLNRARRGEIYDLPGLTYKMVDELLAARKARTSFGSLADLKRIDGFSDELVDNLAAFVVVRPVIKAPADPVKGRVKAKIYKSYEPIDPLPDDDTPNSSHSLKQLGYDLGPQAYVAGEIEAWKWLEAGALVVGAGDINGVVYDPNLRDFHISYGPTFELGRAYVAAHRLAFDAVAGSYTAGFGLGLTFDKSSRTRPDGIYPDMSISSSDSLSLPKRMFGVAVKGKGLDLGAVIAEGTIFLSSARYDVYQYDMGLAGGEEVDPAVDELESPRVYLDDQKLSYITLPNAFREDILGANATIRSGERMQVGLTGWVGQQDRSTIDGVTDPYEWVLRSGYPVADRYGAVGLNAAWGKGILDLSFEAAKSLTGGVGSLAVADINLERTDLQLSARRYGTDFDNPHARGLAAADEYEGMRDRDEQGLRLKVDSRPIKGLDLRSTADLWQTLSTGYWNADLFGRAAWKPIRKLQLVAFAQYKNQNLAVNDRTRIYGGDAPEFDEVGEDIGSETDPNAVTVDPVDRSGTRDTVGVEVSTTAVPRMTISAHYKRYYEDAGLLYPNDGGLCIPWFEIGQYTWFKLRITPVDGTIVSTRVRYRDDDVYGSLDDKQLETYLQIEQQLPKRVKLSARGTVGWDLVDPVAEWADACDRAGEPQLAGTCVVDAYATEPDLEEAQRYSAFWLGAEVRF